MSYADIDFDALMNEYAEEETDKWQYIWYYPYEKCLPHRLLPLEEKNSLIAKFRPNHRLIGCYDRLSGEKNNDVQPGECRFFQIGDVVFDMYDPDSIMSIPIPEVIAFDFEGTPSWYIDQYAEKYHISTEEDTRFLSKKEVDYLIDRAKHLYNGKLSREEIGDLRELFESEETTDIPDNEIEYWTDFVVLTNEEFLRKHPLKDVEDERTPEKYKTIKNHIDTDLFDAVEWKGKLEFQKELVAPLAYVAVNLYICNHDELAAPTRLIAQLFATGEEEYACYLERKLKKMAHFWNPEDASQYGKTLRDWAKNSYEYYWLQNYFPELVPKSKGAYTTAKHKRSKRYC